MTYFPMSFGIEISKFKGIFLEVVAIALFIIFLYQLQCNNGNYDSKAKDWWITIDNGAACTYTFDTEIINIT